MHGLDKIIPTPQIDLCADGSIDLFWKEDQAQLLINFRANTSNALFYGDSFEDDSSIKGKIPTIGVKEHLAVWMKNLAS